MPFGSTSAPLIVGTVATAVGGGSLVVGEALEAGGRLGEADTATVLGIGCAVLTMGLLALIRAFLHELRTTIKANTEAAQRMSDAADQQSKVMVEVKDSLKACDAARQAMIAGGR
jgi:hypothetical protein